METSGPESAVEVFGNLSDPESRTKRQPRKGLAKIGALIIRIGFGGPLYYKCKKETPKK